MQGWLQRRAHVAAFLYRAALASSPRWVLWGHPADPSWSGRTGEQYLARGQMFLSGIRCGKASFSHHYMLLPVLGEEGAACFNGHKVKREIRHIWGQFKPCVRRSLASRLSPTQPDGAKPCDVTLASPPWWRRTNGPGDTSDRWELLAFPPGSWENGTAFPQAGCRHVQQLHPGLSL